MKSRLVVLALCAAFIAIGCQKKEGTADSSMNAKADSMKTAYKAMSAAWDAGNVTEFDKYVSANFVDHNPMPGGKPGIQGMKDMATMMKGSFPDMKSNIEDMRVDGDVLTARFKVSGTNSGPMHGMPATNKKMTDVSGIEMMRWQDGKFVESWNVFDAAGMMMQLGMMPMPGAMPAEDMTKPTEGGKMEKAMEKKSGM